MAKTTRQMPQSSRPEAGFSEVSSRNRTTRIPAGLTGVVNYHMRSLQPGIVMRAIRARLTEAERTVLCTYLRRPSVRGVALQLGTKSQTVRNQLASIRKKLAVKTIPELITKVLISVLCRSPRRNSHGHFNYDGGAPMPSQRSRRFRVTSSGDEKRN
jgi:DNA-binding CsgD family transcriptional regulator